MSKSCSQVILGKDTCNKIKKSNIFIVGVGGIGCQLLKNLSKSGFKKFTILDLDHIEETNLNRQFYFRGHHIGKGKAEIGKQSLLKIDPSLDIIAINGNIFDAKYDYKFYQPFDILISALDNMKAREHLAKMAIMCSKPLIDAGTSAYNGQAKPNIRFVTDCHNCSPSQTEQSFATCTIRSRPQKPIHCAVYAKAFYDSFFGGEQSHSLKGTLNYTHYVKKPISQHSKEQLEKIGIELFEQLFNKTINDIDDDGNKIPLVRKISYESSLLSCDRVINPILSTYKQQEHIAQQKSVYEQQKLWSYKTYSEKFVQSIVNLLLKKQKGQAPVKFQKDDHDCATLICTIMNLRTANFMSFQSTYNKHKFLTFYQAKDMAGKIQPAIASTNSIAAALETRQLINIISGNLNQIKFISIRNYHLEKLSPANMSGPSLSCNVCSPKCLYINIQCNFNNVTIGQFMCFAKKNAYSYGRPCMAGSTIIADENKKIAQYKDLISPNGIIELSYLPVQNQTSLFIMINLINNTQIIGLQITNPKNPQQLRKQIIKYAQMKHQQEIQKHKFDLSDYGYI